jgi:hypothetical protein
MPASPSVLVSSKPSRFRLSSSTSSTGTDDGTNPGLVAIEINFLPETG